MGARRKRLSARQSPPEWPPSGATASGTSPAQKSGMTVIVIEGETLDPAQYLTEAQEA